MYSSLDTYKTTATNKSKRVDDRIINASKELFADYDFWKDNGCFPFNQSKCRDNFIMNKTVNRLNSVINFVHKLIINIL